MDDCNLIQRETAWNSYRGNPGPYNCKANFNMFQTIIQLRRLVEDPSHDEFFHLRIQNNNGCLIKMRFSKFKFDISNYKIIYIYI
jgi:hypothetical protein